MNVGIRVFLLLVSGSEMRLLSPSPAHWLTEAINGGIFPKVPFQQERPT
jgi:hypothetical protein